MRRNAARRRSSSPRKCRTRARCQNCGRPQVIRWWSASRRTNGVGSAGSVLRPLRRAAGRSSRTLGDAAVRAAHRHAAGWTQGDCRARRLRRQRPGDDLHRGLPRLQAVTGSLPLPITMMIEGEEECGSAIVRLRQGQCRATCGRPRARVRHQHVGSGETPMVTTSLRGLVYEEVTAHLRRSRPCIPACLAAPRSNPIRVLSRILAAMHDDNGPRHHSGLLRRRARPSAEIKPANGRASI